ncbi:MAG: ABC transporter permease [Phycisphaerales bacterium]|nr:MAG: ABC transporter permease [Phycisphaerales bacterium]
MRLLPFEYAVRNLGRSPLRLVASIIGSALVVALVLAAGGFVRGMERSLLVSGSHDNVILLGAGSEESVERSQIGMSTATLVTASVPGIRARAGETYVSPEVHMAMVVKTERDSAQELNAVFRGVTAAAFLVHPQVRVAEGRPPRSGENEIMVGQLAATRLGVSPEALAVGKSLWFDHHPWKITGRFEAPNTVMDAEIWCPLTELQIATRRDTLSCVVLTLDDAELEDVAVFCAQRLDLELVAVRESDYYAGLARFYRPVRLMVWVTAALIAIGGLFGGLNTMYAAFGARVRELGALQTLGFSRASIVVSFLQESLLATSCGGLLAAILSMLFLDGLAVRISMGAFALSLDAPVLAGGLAAGACVAVVGIVPPLYRCLRMPIMEALRTA